MQAAADIPVACTLAPAAMAPRLHRIRQLNRSGLLAHRMDGPTLRLTYRPEARTELERIVALERQCCAFLSFELGAVSSGIELVIHAPDGASADAQWLLEQFMPPAVDSPCRGACSCKPGACG